MPIQTIGLPFNAETDTSFPEIAVLPDGRIVAVHSTSSGIDFDIYSADGELLSDGLIAGGYSTRRIVDLAVRPDGSIVLLYDSNANLHGDNLVQIIGPDGTALTAPLVAWDENEGLQEWIDVAADGSFTFISNSAQTNGGESNVVLARFDANGVKIGDTAVYHAPTLRAFVGQHDTQADGTLVIGRTETFFVPNPNPTGDPVETDGTSVDLVRPDGTVTNIDLQIPSAVLDELDNRQTVNETNVHGAPQTAVLDTGGFAVVYHVDLGLEDIPVKYIKFFDDDGSNASAAHQLFAENDNMGVAAGPQFWMVSVAGGKVAVVWTNLGTDALHVAFAWRDAGGNIVSEESIVGNVTPIASQGSSTGVFSVDAAPDGSVYISYRNGTINDYSTIRVVHTAEGVANYVTGTNDGEPLDGTAVGDTIDAEGGNDIVNGLAGSDTLYGGAGNDTVNGGEGSDTINGGTGADTMAGEADNDTFIVDNAGDVIVEGVGQGTLDIVATSISYALGAGVEVEQLQTADGSGASAINLTGNEFAQTLIGADGVNRLDGRAGADLMQGRGGNDVYIVDNAGDVIVEGAGQGTFDLVATSVNYALGADVQVEQLQTTDGAGVAALNLTGNEFVQAIIGNNGVNRIDGKAGADTMQGRGGNDTYIVDNAGDVIIEGAGQGTLDIAATGVSYALGAGFQVEQLQTLDGSSLAALNLTGNEFVQVLIGNNGVNRLDGRAGADTMQGRGGDDTYIVDNAGDLIVEGAGQGDADLVATGVSYALGTGVQVEQLQTLDGAGTGALNLTGNEFVQRLTGNDGVNRIDGRAGADTMVGRGGNDTYIVDNSGDVIIEGGGQGTLDIVAASAGYALTAAAQVEQLQTVDGAATNGLNLYGNNFGQTIIGNNGANSISGKGGADVLQGRGGADNFVFDTALGAGNVDRIVDFTVVDDTVRLENAIFTGLSTGALAANAFVIGAAATNANQHVIYDSATGALSFDDDGTGAHAAIQFATLSTGLNTMTNADFFVV